MKCTKSSFLAGGFVILLGSFVGCGSAAVQTEPHPSPVASASPVASPPLEQPSVAEQKKDGAVKKPTALRMRAPKPVIPSVPQQKLPQLLQDVEHKYAGTDSLCAHFEQVNESAVTGLSKSSSGELKFKRPDKIRWETQAPDANLLVSDGTRFWHYTPPFDAGEQGQVIEKKSTEIHTRLTQALLSGRFSAASDMKIEPKSEGVFLMTPTSKGAGFSKAELTIDLSTHFIVKVKLFHQGGNHSEIKLSQIELGKPLSDALFHFTPPPNTVKLTP